MKPTTLKRSNAPIFWALFGAGGMLSALLGPMLVFITGIAVPLGVAVCRRIP
jgi:fumarate reductase subunit D